MTEREAIIELAEAVYELSLDVRKTAEDRAWRVLQAFAAPPQEQAKCEHWFVRDNVCAGCGAPHVCAKAGEGER